MVVRAGAFLDCCLVAVCGLLTWASVSWALDDSIYSRRCHGRSAWLCDMIKSAQDIELLGYNPILLGVAGLFGWMALFGLRRLASGWTVRLLPGEVQVLRPWGISRIPVTAIAHVTVRGRLFGTTAETFVHTLEGRTVVGANGNVADAARFKAAMNQRLARPDANAAAS